MNAIYRLHTATPSYRERVRETLRILEELPKLGACVVSTSWGKDSVVLVDLALRAWGAVELLHIASPYRLPGEEGLRKAALADSRVTLTEIPSKTLEDVLAWLGEVGLPHERTRSRQAAAVRDLKKDPATEWLLNKGVSVNVLGLRASENERTRGVSLRLRGHTYRLRSGIWAANPLAWWRATDVWAYIFERELDYNRAIYDAETHGLTRESIRNTGWLSTDGASQRGRVAWLRHHFPDQFAQLVVHFPEMASYA